jgi:hypothetical protein
MGINGLEETAASIFKVEDPSSKILLFIDQTIRCNIPEDHAQRNILTPPSRCVKAPSEGGYVDKSPCTIKLCTIWRGIVSFNLRLPLQLGTDFHAGSRIGPRVMMDMGKEENNPCSLLRMEL